MNLIRERNIWIFAGILLVIIIRIDVIIPNLNNLLAIFCFYKAYKINKLIKNDIDKNKCIDDK